jgi:hypothetical protein
VLFTRVSELALFLKAPLDEIGRLHEAGIAEMSFPQMK